MILLAAPRVSKVSATGEADIEQAGSSRLHLFAAESPLVSSEFPLNADFFGSARSVCNFHGHLPHERFYPAGAGVVFAAIEERELQAKFSLARFKTPNGNTQWEL